MDWFARIEQRLTRIEEHLRLQETRTNRNHEHFLTVFAAQRERVEKAFDEVKFALLEQELSLRRYGDESRGEMAGLRETMTELCQTIVDLRDAMRDHEERLQRLEQQRPPAA